MRARDRREAERLIAQVDALRDQVTMAFYKMGRALRALSRPRMYQALEYRSFAELLEAREVTSRVTAMKLITVVDALEEETALRLGVEKSYAFIRYVRAKQPNANVARLAARNPAIREAGTRLGEISVRDLRHAIRVRTGADARDEAAERSADAAAKRLRRALRSRGIDDARITGKARGRSHVVHVELSPEDARALAAALTS